MRLAKVIGSCVSTIKQSKLKGHKILLLQDYSPRYKDVVGHPFMAVDTVGAGQGDIVAVIEGSPAQRMFGSDQIPVDAGIVAIIESFSLDETGGGS